MLPLIKRSQDLFEGAYRARDIGIVDLVTARQRAVRARRESLDAVVRYRAALIRLESTVGRPLARPTPATRPTTGPATQPAAAARPNQLTHSADQRRS